MVTVSLMSFVYEDGEFIPLITGVDNDFVVCVNYTAANLDDGEAVSD
jgi:hypothetical protein